MMDRETIERALEHASKERDRRLRRMLLTALFELRGRPVAWFGVRALADLVNGMVPESDRFEMEQNCVVLLRDLVIAGFAEERHKARRRGKKRIFRHLQFRISSTGLKLYLQYIPPDPLVADDRIL